VSGTIAGVTVHQADREGWLIPAAVAFLAVCVIFAVVMMLWHGGIGSAGVPAGAASGSPGGASAAHPAHPSPTGDRVVALHQVGSGLCLDVQIRDKPEGAPAEQLQCSGVNSQRWRLRTGTGGAVMLVNTASGKCLDVSDRSTKDGAHIQQWTCNGGSNQQWRLNGGTSGGPVALISVGSGKCLDVPNASHDESAKLQQFTCNGTDAQHWTLS
jgi:hypothetical protein